ncbi:MAG TPA: HAD-IC family P-type ATPase [Pseudolysinimonas sp.]|nr:HAD-IC family P-type ATPase [Pseudolysinimonas sp.]
MRQREESGRTNRVTPHTSRSLWEILRANVFTLFNGIVGGLFVLLLVLGEWRDALFGFSALTNAAVGVVQEYRAKRSLDRLALLSAARATVVRDGVELQIERHRVVGDDLLILRTGDQVPADAGVVEAHGLSVDESMLTGESAPVHKQPGDELLAGSSVVTGSGRAVVSRVGEGSFAARLAGEARAFSLVRSEIRDSINRVLRVVAWALGPVALVVVNGQMQAAGGWQTAIESGAWRPALVGAAGAVIAMVPLGLVLLASVAFTVGMVRLARHGVLAQELPAVEGLARVDLVCFDKTGTLTDGDVEFDAAHELTDDHGWRQVLASFAADEDANITARSLGDAFPGAGVSPTLRIAFSSDRKWSAHVHAAGDPLAGSWVLGAPELVLAGRRDPRSRAALAECAAHATAGLRVLLLARAHDEIAEPAAGAEPLLPAGLRPQVIVTLRERIRPDAAETVAYFRAEGVGLLIISGDDPRTAAAVARRVGIDAPDGFDARDLPDDPAELRTALERHQVFGRVAPAQKRDMVEALRSAGHVVAMTGDGVNDILALKAADIGIAMNTAAPATRAVARLVLLDGRFSRLPVVVAEGRRVIANIERVSKLYLSKTVYSVLIAVGFGALLWGYPFLPRQLSVLDGISIGLPGFVLAFLPNTRRYLPGFLRRTLGFAVPAGAVIAFAMLAIGLAAHLHGATADEARTASSVVLAVLALWVLNVLLRPLDIRRVGLLIVAHLALVLALVIPLVSDFLQWAMPSAAMLWWMSGSALAGIVGLEAVVRWSLRPPRSAGPSRRSSAGSTAPPRTPGTG